jgi:predicted dehydrogenase
LGKDRGWKTYTDFREMIANENLDGVMIETTTHARAWITISAMQAGMDVYIEKPMCLTIAEGRAMVEAARHYNRVTQVGTQQRSMPINNWASDLVKDGALGKVHTVIAPNFVGPERWTEQTAQPMPAADAPGWWDLWTNQAPLRPYHADIHHGWDRWWDYDGGGRCFGVTGWGTHAYDQIQRALGTDDTGPVEVWLAEPVQVLPTGKFETPLGNLDTGVDYRGLAQPVIGPRAKVRMKYANGTELRLDLDGDWGPGLGAIFVGDQGKIEINRNKIASHPKELVESPDNPGPNTKPETQYHIENWVECIKTRQRCNADIEYGLRATTLCYLVNIVRDVGRVGEKLQWDPEKERFTNCDEANALLSRPRRKGFELPAISIASTR